MREPLRANPRAHDSALRPEPLDVLASQNDLKLLQYIGVGSAWEDHQWKCHVCLQSVAGGSP